jgi:hypothetical protein
VKFRVQAELGALDYEIWEQAKLKLARERSGTVTDAEMMAELSRMLLSTKADGSVPGRKPVEDSCFRVVVDAKTKQVHTEDGPVPLSDAEVAVAVDAAELTKAQRKRVLDRDGHHCRCCRSRRNLQVHHVRFVSRGGGTGANNLLALCSYCHGRIHEGLLRVRAKPRGGLEFQDRRGRSLRGALPHPLQSTVAYRSRTQKAPRQAAAHQAAMLAAAPRHPSRHAPSTQQTASQQMARPASAQQALSTQRSSQQRSRWPEVVDAAFVLQNLDRLKWRSGKMVLV